MRLLLDAIGGCCSGLPDLLAFPHVMARPNKLGACCKAE